jgi:hypothetical protein
VSTWLARELSDATALPRKVAGFSLAYTVENVPGGNTPSREGPDIARYVLYWRGPAQWRWNVDATEWNPRTGTAVRQGWADSVMNGSYSFSLSDAQLSITQASSDSPYTSAPQKRGGFEADLGLLFYGGLKSVADRQPRISSVAITGEDRWEFRAELPAYTVRLEGAWRDGRGFVSRSTIVEAPGHPELVGRTTECGPWRYESEPGLWICQRVQVAASPTVPGRIVTWVGAEPVAPATFDSILAIPEYGASDPIRGVQRFGRLLDERSGVREVTDRTERGIRRERIPTESNWKTIRYLGWAVAGLIVAALVLLRARALLNGPR